MLGRRWTDVGQWLVRHWTVVGQIFAIPWAEIGTLGHSVGALEI